MGANLCEWADMVEGDCESALLIVSVFSVKEIRSSARSEDGQVLEV